MMKNGVLYSSALYQFYHCANWNYHTAVSLHSKRWQPEWDGSRNDEQRCALFIQCLLVKHVLSETRTNTLQVSDVIRDLLDGFHLLIKELALQPVSHLTTTNNSDSDGLQREHCQHSTLSLIIIMAMTSIGRGHYVMTVGVCLSICLSCASI